MRPALHAATALLLLAGCGSKKPAEPTGPIVGWHQEEGAVGACWYPPSFAELGAGARRAARDEGLQAIKGQWLGERSDGVAFDTSLVEGIETILLGYPDKIEAVAAKNVELCRAAMAGGGTGAWRAWLGQLPSALIEGECLRPLDATMFWYLDVGMGWQGGTPICSDNVVRITASSKDQYRVQDDGPWINVEGDPNQRATGSEYPCTVEGCNVGTLVLRFRGDSGAEIVQPIGTELVFSPPEHGTIEFMINDTTYFDNVFRVEGGLQHRTSITYKPVE